MNRKGRFFVHGIMLTAVIVITLLAISSISTIVSGIGKGEGQLEVLSFLSEVRASEYHVDQSLRFLVWNTTAHLAKKGGFYEESGCGTTNKFPLWNTADKTCYPQVSQEFSELFEDKLEKSSEKLFRRNVEFIEYDYESYNPFNGDTRAFLVEFPEKITASFEHEHVVVLSKDKLIYRVLGGKMVQKKLFKYYVNLGYDLQAEYRQLAQEATRLLLSCQNTVSLEQCLDTKKETHWYFTSCGKDSYDAEARKVAFCATSPDNSKIFNFKGELQELEYHFALDFTPVFLPTINEIFPEYNLAQEAYEISFIPHELDLSYTVYVGKDIMFSGPAFDVGILFPQVQSFDITEIELSCPDQKEAGFAYECSDLITFVISSESLEVEAPLSFAITSSSDAEESDIFGFVAE
jgi:hypothetical protein